jgi:Uma2 family endonuclease
MTPQLPRPERLTIDEYLRRERAAFEKSMYLDGQVIAMAGESLSHGRISTNLAAMLHTQLRGGPCEVFSKDLKTRSIKPGPFNPRSRSGLFSYPDVVIVCGEPECHDEYQDVITNPKVIFEVLSPSTEKYDRGEKFFRYQTWNPTLTDYLLVSQDRPQVEHFTRQTDGSWRYTLTEGLAATVSISSVGCTLKLADVYDRVPFPDLEPDEA